MLMLKCIKKQNYCLNSLPFCKVLLKSYINLAIIHVHEHLIGRMVIDSIFM